MEEHDKLSKLFMWSKIKELISDGLNFSQISRRLDLHRQTVAHYASMSYEEFVSSTSYQREYAHKLDEYEEFVVALLRKYPFVSSAQVHDRLKEKYGDMPRVSDKTVFNFVRRLRLTHDIPKEEDDDKCRQMTKLPETDYGEYAQVDFGEKWMRGPDSKKVKVYFMVMVLSRSRYKFVYFSKTPFTTALAIYAHELAFRYYGGKPQKLVYDQDRVFIRDENLGDYLLTARFRTFCTLERLELVFCRKSDPQSKGKVENAVKYVKNNFLSAREYSDIDTLNKECLAWLERTANGTMHHGIRQIPAEVFAIEREWLTVYSGEPSMPEERMQARLVRQDNTFMYEGNYYSVPSETYKGGGKPVQVYVEVQDGILNAYSEETGKMIASHTLCHQKGRTISNANHLRQPSLSLEELAGKVRKMLPDTTEAGEWLCKMRESRSRYYRDSLKVIERECWKYTPGTLSEAIAKCREKDVYNANTLFEVARQIRIAKGEREQPRPAAIERIASALPEAEIRPDTSSIATYKNIIGDAV